MQVLLSEDEIQASVRRLAERLSEEYRGKRLTVLGVLTGSLMFHADLIRRMDIPLRVGVLQASSYRGTATSPGKLSIDVSQMPDIAGRDVLLLDDIFDTGQTLSALIDALSECGPRSLKTVVLLWKEGRRRVSILPDYHAFKIPDKFVVGYGLDYDDDFRHLPYVAALEESDLKPTS